MDQPSKEAVRAALDVLYGPHFTKENYPRYFNRDYALVESAVYKALLAQKLKKVTGHENS